MRKSVRAASHARTDDFDGDTPTLVRSIMTLLEMDAAGALTPHGVGDHARKLLTAAAARLCAVPPFVPGPRQLRRLVASQSGRAKAATRSSNDDSPRPALKDEGTQAPIFPLRSRVTRLLVELHASSTLSEQQCAKVLGVDLVTWRKIAGAVDETCKCRRLGDWKGFHHPLCDKAHENEQPVYANRRRLTKGKDCG